MAEFDLRVVKIGVEVNGRLKIYEGLSLAASGTKYANGIQNDCQIKITNLDKATADYIGTETSPFNPNKLPKIITLDAGRVSYGTTRIFTGNVASISISQPPDITLTLKCLTGEAAKANVVSRGASDGATMQNIATQVAKDLNVTLDFQAANKMISNYSFTGGALKQVDALGEMGNVNAYIDNDVLVVKDAGKPLRGRIKIVSEETGLIGIPETTELGVKVKFLLDTFTTLGGALRLQSKLYPALNGDYTIYKLGFEIANRAEPFYWIAEASRGL